MARNIRYVSQSRAIALGDDVDQISADLFTGQRDSVDLPGTGFSFDCWYESVLDSVCQREFRLKTDRMAPLPVKEKQKEKASQQTE